MVNINVIHNLTAAAGHDGICFRLASLRADFQALPIFDCCDFPEEFFDMPQLKTSLTVADLKVIIIDDMQSNRRQLERQMKGLGFAKIDTAPGVIEAVEKMQATAYDIIITDWNMPNGTGLDLLRACRQDPNYDNVAIVMASSASESGAIAEALKEGATGYIVKPVTDNDLADHMNKLLDWVERHR